MPSFKPKNNKKIVVPKSEHLTVDTKHTEMISYFKKNKNEKIPKLKLDLKRMIGKIEKKKYNDSEEKFDIAEKIKHVQKEIQELEDAKMNYLLTNSKYIFEYFENKKKISDGLNETCQQDNHNINGKQTYLMSSFFKQQFDSSAQLSADPVIKQSLLQNYFKNVDAASSANLEYSNMKMSNCSHCLKGEIIHMEDEGIMLCNNCYVISKYLIENEKPSYREPPREVCFYAYKKINHFKEILAQFQGKESTFISEEILTNIKLQIKKERIEIEKITYDELKALLKKLGYNKYYEHINFIKNKLGVACRIIPQHIEECLCNFFIEIQYPYAKHCPDYRINFLHYYYVLFKLFQLIGETEYLSDIPMLKDKDKLIEQDNIWKKICMELNWEFISTM